MHIVQCIIVYVTNRGAARNFGPHENSFYWAPKQPIYIYIYIYRVVNVSFKLASEDLKIPQSRTTS